MNQNNFLTATIFSGGRQETTKIDDEKKKSGAFERALQKINAEKKKTQIHTNFEEKKIENIFSTTLPGLHQMEFIFSDYDFVNIINSPRSIQSNIYKF